VYYHHVPSTLNADHHFVPIPIHCLWHEVFTTDYRFESLYYGCIVFGSTNFQTKWDILVSWWNNRFKFLVDV
jgi:hypothetical protein